MSFNLATRQKPNADVEFDKQVARLNNQPRPHVPKWFVWELNAIGGRDVVTGKPNYRLVWGQGVEAQKMVLINGVATMKPMYPKEFVSQMISRGFGTSTLSHVVERREAIGHDCFFIEKYVPARNINRDTWENDWRFYVDPEDVFELVLIEATDDEPEHFESRVKKIDVMGPYPEEGMYVEYLCLRDQTTGEAVMPCQQILNDLRANLNWEQTFDELTPKQVIENMIKARREEERKRDIAHVLELRDILIHYQKGLREEPIVGVLTNNLQPLNPIAGS